MANLLLNNATYSGPQAPLGLSLPCMIGASAIHLFGSSYVNTGAKSIQNLAGPGAAAASYVGSPTISGGIFKINTAGTDYGTLGAALDNGGDLTVYLVVQNNDTLAGGTTQPVFLSNAGADPAHGSVPTGTKGVTIQPSSTTQVAVHDYQLVGGASTNKFVAGTIPNLATTTKWSSLVFTSSTTGGSQSNLTLYDPTAGDATGPAVTTTTGTSGRAFNATQAWRFGLGNGSNYGLCSIAFLALFQTATGGGGAHSAAQIAQNAARIEALMATLGITV